MTYEMKQEDFEFLKTLPGNTRCVDCGDPHPDWGSPNFGILFCFNCSGRHRGLGTHISFVRSVAMDSWTEKQISLMKAGGNDACNSYLKRHGVKVDGGANGIKEKYDCPAAELYKQVLVARLEGRPEPTELPKQTPKTASAPRKMQGFGSSPPPPPTEFPSFDYKLLAVPVAAVAIATTWFLVVQQQTP